MDVTVYDGEELKISFGLHKEKGKKTWVVLRLNQEDEGVYIHFSSIDDLESFANNIIEGLKGL